MNQSKVKMAIPVDVEAVNKSRGRIRKHHQNIYSQL